jgi:hypothetical protein
VVDVLWPANCSWSALAFLSAGCVDVRVHLCADSEDIKVRDAKYIKLSHDGFCVRTGWYVPDESDQLLVCYNQWPEVSCASLVRAPYWYGVDQVWVDMRVI